MKHNYTKSILMAAVLGFIALGANAQMTFTSGTGMTQTQNFNTITNTSISSTGWQLGKGSPQTTTTSLNGTNYTYPTSGIGTTGDFFNTGVGTDRVIGSLSSSNNANGGNHRIGVMLVNNTTVTIGSFNISAVFEKYRSNNNSLNAAERYPFEYSLTATSVIGTGFTNANVSNLDGIEPDSNDNSSTILNGNSAANQTAISGSITGLTLAPGGFIWIRWTDADDAGSDALIGIDDVSITAVEATCTPAVSISASPSGNICAGTNVTFSIASSTNLGTSPTYEWSINMIPQGGATNSTYNTTALANNDMVTLTATSNAACASANPTVTSSAYIASVTTPDTPTVTIATPSNNVCSGTPVTFNVVAQSNAGSSPAYQWTINGTPQPGDTTNSFTTSSLSTNDAVKVILTSNSTCKLGSGTVFSNQINVLVNNNVTPSVVLTSSDADNKICQGDAVTFTANGTNTGSSPTYEFFLNGVSVSTNSFQYSNAGLANGDQVKVVLTSNASCATKPTDTSSTITTLVSTAPTVGPSGLFIDNETSEGFRVNYTIGNGSGSIVVVSQGAPLNTTPACGQLFSDPTINGFAPNNGRVEFNIAGLPVLGNGKVVYKNYDTTASNKMFTVGSLTPNTQFYVYVYEFDSSASGIAYFTGGVATVSLRTLLTPPTVKASNFNAGYVDSTTALLTWTNGNGDGRLVSIKNGVHTSKPDDLNTYTPSTVFGQGSDLGTGEFVIYQGTGSSVTVTGLTYNKQYRVSIYEYNAASPFINYNTNKYLFKGFRLTTSLREGLPVNGFEEETAAVSLYPNPAQDNVTIQFGDATGKASIRILSITGQQLMTQEANADNGAATISVSNLAKGMYMVEVTLDGQKFVSRLMKQ